jgi:hypothetical protein
MNANSNTQEVTRVPGDAPGPSMDVTWSRAAKVWWSLAWRGVLFGGTAGFLAGFVVGFVMWSPGAPRRLLTTMEYLAGALVGIPVGIWVVRNVLKKSWSDFRIALVPKTSE